MHFLKRCAIALLLAFGVSSCGFHLRGAAPLPLPLENIYLQVDDPYSKLAHNLRQYFKMNGVHLADSPKHATTVLDIVKQDAGQQLLSVGGTLETRQYNLTFTVTFQLLDSRGRMIVSNQTLSETRTLTIQASQMLGGSNEAESMYEQMREAIVYDIINRLSSKEITARLTNAEKTFAEIPDKTPATTSETTSEATSEATSETPPGKTSTTKTLKKTLP